MKKLEKAKTWMTEHKKLIGGVVIGAGAIAGGVIFGKTFNVSLERKHPKKEATGWGISGHPKKGDGIDFSLFDDHHFGFCTIEGKALTKHFDRNQAEGLVESINEYLGKGLYAPDTTMHEKQTSDTMTLKADGGFS